MRHRRRIVSYSTLNPPSPSRHRHYLLFIIIHNNKKERARPPIGLQHIIPNTNAVGFDAPTITWHELTVAIINEVMKEADHGTSAHHQVCIMLWVSGGRVAAFILSGVDVYIILLWW